MPDPKQQAASPDDQESSPQSQAGRARHHPTPPLEATHWKPGLPLRTMKALTWLVSLLRAQMIATSANVPLPIQRLRPLSTQPPCTRRAVVVRAEASEPLEGSVSAQQPTLLQRTKGGGEGGEGHGGWSGNSVYGATGWLAGRAARRPPPPPLLNNGQSSAGHSKLLRLRPAATARLKSAIPGSSSCFCASLPSRPTAGRVSGGDSRCGLSACLAALRSPRLGCPWAELSSSSLTSHLCAALNPNLNKATCHHCEGSLNDVKGGQATIHTSLQAGQRAAAGQPEGEWPAQQRAAMPGWQAHLSGWPGRCGQGRKCCRSHPHAPEARASGQAHGQAGSQAGGQQQDGQAALRLSSIRL